MSDYSLPMKFDLLIHQQSRLSIMAVLIGCESADFTFLAESTGLTKGTLSKHLSKLYEAGYIEIEKTFKGKYPLTLAKVTKTGRKAFKDYRHQLATFNQIIDGD